MKGQKVRNVIRCFAFILIFCVLLYGVNGLLAEKWWYPMFSESPAYQYNELYETNQRGLQAVFLGTSHMENGVDPMQIYKDKGFVTFNMASSNQPIEGSYYVLEEVFRLSKPSYVFYDVSKLITSSVQQSTYRLILENLRWGLPKLQCIRTWTMLEDKEDKQFERLASAFFPIIQYHDRWKSLTEQDIVNESGKRHYYRKGFCPRTGIESGQLTSIEWMNEIAETKYLKEIENRIFEDSEESVIEGIPTSLYQPEISVNNQEILIKMRDLCHKHQAELILVKIPSIRPPQKYTGAWTKVKSNIVKQFADKADVVFLDLLYDYDLGIDWDTDTRDNGAHLNYLGSRKLTRFFENYLSYEGLHSQNCIEYDEDLNIYDKICRVADLESIQEYNTYFQMIQNMRDVTIFISVRDDMKRCISQEDIETINRFGIQTRIEELQYSDALTIVIEDGKVIYEESSNGTIKHTGLLRDGKMYQIISSGYLADDNSQIIIDDVNYSANKRGINVVVYDHESGLVIDSCTFDTWATDSPKATRTLGNFSNVLCNYEEWCMQEGYNP